MIFQANLQLQLSGNNNIIRDFHQYRLQVLLLQHSEKIISIQTWGRLGADYFKSTVKSISYESVTIEWE